MSPLTLAATTVAAVPDRGVGIEAFLVLAGIITAFLIGVVAEWSRAAERHRIRVERDRRLLEQRRDWAAAKRRALAGRA